MKKIMLIIPSLTGGGAEKTIANLSYFLEKKYEVYVVVFDLKNKTYDCVGNIISLNLGEGGSFLKKILKNIFRIYKINKLKKELKIDVSISFLDMPNIINVITKNKEKVIVSIRNFQSKKDNSFIKKKVTQFFLKKSDTIVSLSEMVKQDLMIKYKINSKKIKTIYNPCYLKNIEENCREKLDDEKFIFDRKLNVITCGRLTEQKGQWHLIRVIAYLKNKNLDIKLIILGQGELENKLKKLVKDLNIEENVIFLGYKKNPYKYIAKANLFVFTSLFEGLGNVLLETMACNIPIISSNCLAGPAEILLNFDKVEDSYKTSDIIFGDYGILVPSFKNDNFDSYSALNKEEQKLLEILLKCYKDKNIYKKYKEKGKERLKEFSENKIKAKWEDLIEN